VDHPWSAPLARVRPPGTGCPTPTNRGAGDVCQNPNLCLKDYHICDATGQCVGQTDDACPVDECHVAVACNAATGMCDSVRKPDDTPCSDGNRCTVGDRCRGGTCMPGTTNGCAAPGDTVYARIVNLGSEQGGSFAVDINDAGEIVAADQRGTMEFLYGGDVPSRAFRWKEYLDEAGQPTSRRDNLPQGSEWQFPNRINNSGVVVGVAVQEFWWQTLFRHAPNDPQLTITQGFGKDINDLGVITGCQYYPEALRTIRLRDGVVEKLSAPAELLYACGYGIDSAGNVVGNATPDGSTESYIATRYTNTGFEDLNRQLPTNLPPDEIWHLQMAYATNGTDIVGWGTRNGVRHGYRLRPGTTITDLGIPTTRYAANNPNNNVVAPHDINAAGEIVGAVYYDSWPGRPQTAFIWVEGAGIIDLNTLIDPASGWDLRLAYAVNNVHTVNGKNVRDVVGMGFIGGQPRAFKMTLPDLGTCPPSTNLCEQGPGTRNLATGACTYAPRGLPPVANLAVDDLPQLGGNYSIAQDVNMLGQIVGLSVTASGQQHAVLWPTPGAVTDLGVVAGFPADSNAAAINEGGTVAGLFVANDGARSYKYSSSGGLQDLGIAGDGSVVTDTFQSGSMTTGSSLECSAMPAS